MVTQYPQPIPKKTTPYTHSPRLRRHTRCPYLTLLPPSPIIILFSPFFKAAVPPYPGYETTSLFPFPSHCSSLQSYPTSATSAPTAALTQLQEVYPGYSSTPPSTTSQPNSLKNSMAPPSQTGSTHRSYRTELFGIYAGTLVLHHLCIFFHIT